MPGLPVTFTSSALEHAPESWTRIEAGEIAFAECCGGETTGVVIRERFDTAPRPGSRDANRGLTGSELKDAARAAGVAWFKDLETNVLPLLTGDPEHDGSHGRTALAQAVPLPLFAGALEDTAVRERLVKEALRVQAGASKVFAPFFPFKTLDDPWLTVSLLCVDSARFLSPRTPISAWISVPLSALRDGTLLKAIPLFARRLAPGADIVITVGEVSQKLPLPDQIMYFEVLAACADAGMRVLPDRVDELSVSAVALFAVGCLLGTSRYRVAGDPYVLKTEKRRPPSVKYHVARKGQRLSVAVARRRRANSVIPRCADRECPALKPGIKNRKRALRLHNAHDVYREILRARALGPSQYVEILRKRGLVFQKRIAQAVVRVNERRKAA